MAPKFVFFDSNTWIYLSNGFEVFSKKYLDLHFKVFEILQKRVWDGSLIIFTNEIVKEEWKRNEEDAATQLRVLTDKAKSYTDQLRAIGQYLDHDQDQIEKMVTAVIEQTDKKIEMNKRHIEKVKHFIEHQTQTVAVTDEHRIEASLMAQRTQAPFRGDKSNSMSDALILLSITDFLDTSKPIDHPAVNYAIREDGAFSSYFISSNFGDFANLPDKHTIHPDLEPILARSGTVYHPSLGPLIEELEKEFLSHDELRALELSDGFFNCYLCEADYRTLKFSEPRRTYDPYKFNRPFDPNQLILFDDIPLPDNEKPFSNVETAYCGHCNTDFIVCPNCDTMFNIDVDEVSDCPGCHYNFFLEVVRNRKGAIDRYVFSIVKQFACTNCGDQSLKVNEEGMCDACVGYKQIFASQEVSK